MSESPALPGAGMSWSIRIRLSLMMFLQFMMFAVFWVPISAYLQAKVGTSSLLAWGLSAMAIGCLASPLVGMIADRHFASQKVLAVLNVLSAALLVAVSQVQDPTLLVALLIVQQLCYMPTWGLTSSIAMTHSPAEKFAQIRSFGSFGWVAAAAFSLVAGLLFKNQAGEAMTIDGTNIPFLCGAGTALVGAVVALTLPNTPPPAKGQKASVIDALGLRSFSLMKDSNFSVFLIFSTLVMIPFTIYFNFIGILLQSQGVKYVTLTANLGQFGEIFLILLVPIALAKIGVKWTMVVGLLAMVVRYLLFLGAHQHDNYWMVLSAIGIHGIIFGFFFVGGQVYVDKRAPKELRAQAQGLLFLITFGIGMIAGNFFNQWLLNIHSTTVGTGAAAVTTYDWAPIWQITTAISAVLMLAMIVFFRVKTDKKLESPAEAA